MNTSWTAATLSAVIIGTAVGCWLAWRRFVLRHCEQTARRRFRLERERLEAQFIHLAAANGKPRGLRWVDVDFRNEVCFARDRSSGGLTAFVGVSISFEAVPGGEMEDVAAVGDIRDAAAVFHYNLGRWGTGGRVLFNVGPREAVDRFQKQFEALPDTTEAS